VSADWPWDVLDMRPSGDVRAIRRAYAAALKSGDYDSDTDGFMALREARDVALALAETIEIDDFDVGLGGDEVPAVVVQDRLITDADIASVEPTPAVIERPADPIVARHEPPPQEFSPQSELEGRPLEDMYQALYDALIQPFDQYRQTLDQASPAVRLEAILQDPRLAELSVHDAADAIISEIFVRTMPASDDLVPRASAYFGWAERASQIDISPAVRILMERGETLAFLSEVKQRGHRLNGAWRVMSRPPRSVSWPLWASKKRVNELMQLVRVRHPMLEQELNGEQVGNWEFQGRASGAPIGWIAFGCYLAFVILIGPITSVLDPSGNRPRTAIDFMPPLTTVNADLGKALRGMLGDAASVEDLKKGNPPLYADLAFRWQDDRLAGVPYDVYAAGVRSVLIDRAVRSYSRISYKTLVEQWRIRRDAAKEGVPRLPTRCTISLSIAGLLPMQMSDALAKRVRANIAQSLIEAKDPLPALTEYYSYSIPGSIVMDTAQRLKMTRDQVERVLQNGEETEIKCRVREALVDATLAAPKSEAIEVLRGM